MAGEIAAKIEFLTTNEITLRNANVPHMSEPDTAFKSIAKKTVRMVLTCLTGVEGSTAGESHRLSV